MWGIWPKLPTYGRKAAQFVDLLGYLTLKMPQSEKKVRIQRLGFEEGKKTRALFATSPLELLQDFSYRTVKGMTKTT